MTNLEPMMLDDLPKRGATMYGTSVARVVVMFEDGRRNSFELPKNLGALTSQQERILQILIDAEQPLTRKAVALSLGYSDTKGNFGQSLRDMVSREIIFSSGGLITDDAKKFTTKA